MQFQALYLIEARHVLRDRLVARVEAEFAELVVTPMLLSNKEADRSSWSEMEHTLAVKLMFLASLKDYDPLRDDRAFGDIFGSSRISVSLFDKWWTIRRLERDADTAELQSMLKTCLPITDATGNPIVDAWLEWLSNKT